MVARRGPRSSLSLRTAPGPPLLLGVAEIDLDQHAFGIGYEKLRQPAAGHHAFLEGHTGFLQPFPHGRKIIAPESDMIEGAGSLICLGNDDVPAPGSGAVRSLHQMHHRDPAQIEPMAPEGEVGPLAVRQPYQKYGVAVKRSAIDGFGVFAAEAVPAHRKIGEIRGETISVSEARRRVQGQVRIMMVEISTRKAIDASASTDAMRFTNHACQPNARLQIRDGRIEFYALRLIGVGEEITVNYGQTHHAGTLACRCGTPGCAGWI